MIVLKVLLVYLALAVVLWGMGQFIHRFLYTDVPDGMYWRGAAGAGVIWFVGLVWPLLLNEVAGTRWPIKFDQMFLFEGGGTSATFKELIVVEEGGKETRYERRKNASGMTEYRDAELRALPSSAMVLLAVPETGNERQRFEVIKDKDGYIDRSRGGARYRNDAGQVMLEENLGQISSSGIGYAFLYLFADLVTWTAWFLALWLILLFQWQHALAISFPGVFLWAVALNFVF